MKYTKRVIAIMLLSWLAASPAYSQEAAWLIDVKGAIGPATADHMVRGLGLAQETGAKLIIIRIDTPGGLDTAMRGMIKAILASWVPVTQAMLPPSGSRALFPCAYN